MLDCQTYAHKLKEDNKELAKQRGEQKEKRKIIAPKRQTQFDQKGRLLQNSRPKMGDIQIILCSDARKLFYCWAI